MERKALKMPGILEKAVKNAALQRAADELSLGRSIQLGGVWGSSAALLAGAVGQLAKATVLLVTAHLDDADELADDVEVLTGAKVHNFGAWEVDIGTEHVNDEIVAERLRLCGLLSQPQAKRDERVNFITAPIMALLQPVPTADTLAAGRLELVAGAHMPPDELAEWLVDAGYENVDQVDVHGEFARRGGIIDIFPPGEPQAIRVEFFGDEMESIRRFDLDTLRSTEPLAGCTLNRMTAGLDAPLAEMTSLLSYLPQDAIICMSQPDEIRELARQLYDRAIEQLPEGATLLLPDDVLDKIGSFRTVEMHPFSGRATGANFALGIRSLQKLAMNTHEALGELGELAGAADVFVYCETAAEQMRFEELLAASHPELAGRLKTAVGHVNAGFYWPDERLVVVGHHEIFHRYAKVRRIRRVRAGRPIESLLDLSDGDYVVHVGHGIAKFEGLRQLERDGRSEEYLVLRFAENAVLNVPASRINLVQKYIGSRQRRPQLSTLGGRGWLKQKERAAASVRDLAAEMLRIQAMRASQPGVSYPAGTDWQRRFSDEFLYTETEDQLAAIAQMDEDMSRTRPMDRLLCGDVGYGKTEIAMRAAFKVVEAGRQVGVLVPTTVLAEQHYRTFRERFADYPFEIEVISRFRTPSQQADIIRRLSLGQIDILIGTHRLLSDDIRFSDLGLAIIDEEQRFGVEHKEKLKAMRATLEILTMTATPIPRTLHMALLGLRDISSLSTPPLDRRAIHTEVVHYDDRLIRQAILRELNREGQVFFVHNRVFNIKSVADHVQKLVPEARVDFAHGQMTGSELEKVMLRFIRCEIDVLVCTTIIESGLDIPTANTMIIHDADRFGLAELHQLRGRVGRYKHKAYCYLLLPEDRPVSVAAAKRLKTIEEFSDLGAGFQIAMRDLEIRGAGNILGAEQSGHIATVGYELYCQLLEQAVGELQGKPQPVSCDMHIELGIDAYIPSRYIPSGRQRMEVYRRLAQCHSSAELDQLTADLADAYGAVPSEVQTVLDLAAIRIFASMLGIKSIIRHDPDLVFDIRDFSRAKRVFDNAMGSVRLPDDHTVYWRPPPAYMEMPTLTNVLLRRLRQAAERL